MRLDKTFARILLIFSIAGVILAAPALVQQRRLVTDRSGGESTDQPKPLPAPDSDMFESSLGWGGPPKRLKTSPPSPAVVQDLGPVSVTPQLNDPASVSGTSELHSVPPSMLGNPPSQDYLQPASEAAPILKDPQSGTGAQPVFEDSHPSWQDFRPQTEIEEVAGPNVHDDHPANVDDHNDHFYDPHSYETVDYNDLIKLEDKVKTKEYCFVCWDWHFSRSFEWGPKRKYGQYFS